MEDGLNSIRSEWHSMKEKWFHGETIDPVFEGVVRDFCAFDESMISLQTKVQTFMKGVEQLATGMTALSDGVSSSLSHASDHQIASDSCKLKEATNQIARADAPHSAISKLRRDMMFNILNPVQAHITNNRNLKVSLDIRRRRLVEYTAAKKQFEECSKKNLSPTDRRYLQAQANFEAAKATFTDVDRHVFEWLYILEEYRGDILDSTLQTIKYLQYEFFATASHSVSSSLPSRMEFRPMVEMTPDHLEVQVEMELQENEGMLEEGADGGVGAVADFSLRLIEKKAKEEPDEHSAPALPVDPLSLSSLLSQGFEEGPARRALRMHQNNTQAALDWLIDGGTEEAVAAKKVKAVEDGVRMPTTVKRVQKLKAMRKKKQEKNDKRESSRREEREEGRAPASGGSSPKNHRDVEESRDRKSDAAEDRPPPLLPETAKKPEPVDLLEVNEVIKAPAQPSQDLLGFDSEEPAVPTDFSKPIEMLALPQLDLFYDGGARCEKPPLATSVAAGIALPRAPELSPDALAGFSPELLAQVQALATQSQVSPQQLLLAAAQAQSQPPQAAAPAMGMYSGVPSGSPLILAGSSSGAAPGGLDGLDPFEGLSASPPPSGQAPAAAAGYPAAGSAPPGGTGGAAETDQFSSLVGLLK